MAQGLTVELDFDTQLEYDYYQDYETDGLRLWQTLLLMLTQYPKIVAYDVETNGLDPLENDLTFIQIKHNTMPCVIVDVRKWRADGKLKNLGVLLKPLLEDNEWLVVGHNLKFDRAFTQQQLGVTISDRLYDTMLAEKVISAGLVQDVSLAEVAYRYVGVRLDKSVRMDFVTLGDNEVGTEHLEYMAMDTELLETIMYQQIKKLKSENLVQVAKLEFEVMPALCDASLRGIRVDKEFWSKFLLKQYGLLQEKESRLVDLLTPYVAEWRLDNLVNNISRRYLSNGSYESAKLAQSCDAQSVYDQTLSATGSKGDARKAFNTYKKTYPLPDKNYFGPINLRSPQQLQAALSYMDIPLPIKGDSISTEADDLEMIAEQYPICQDILDFRETQKTVSSFGDNILDLISADSRIHPDINQCIKTGRMSFRRPNLQQIPGDGSKNGSELRKAFLAASGYKLVVSDYNQIELRVLAQITEEPVMIDSFESNMDLHSATAWTMFPDKIKEKFNHFPMKDLIRPLTDDYYGPDDPKFIKDHCADLRHVGKTLNFAIIYGLTGYGLSRQLHIPRDEAQKYVDNWMRTHPVIKEWLEKVKSEGIANGYSSSLLGRKRYFPPLGEKPLVRGSEEWRNYLGKKQWYERMLANHIVQSTAADITKLAICRIRKRIQEEQIGAHLILVVHDELVYEVEDDEDDTPIYFTTVVADEMIEAGRTFIDKIPVLVDARISDRWSKEIG